MSSPDAPCANHPDRLAAAICGRCGDFICAGCAHLQDAATLCDRCVHSAASGPAPIPWETRGAQGWLAAWWATTQEALLSPLAMLFGKNLFDRLGPRGRYGPATGYAFLNLGGWLLLWALSSALQQTPALLTVPEGVRWDSGPGVELIMSGVALVVLAVVLVPGLYSLAAVVHTVGMVLGVDRGGFRGTFRAVAYSTGGWPLAGLLALPLVGLKLLALGLEVPSPLAQVPSALEVLLFMLALKVWLVLMFAALRGAHGASALRAAGVVLATLILCLGTCCGLSYGTLLLLGRF